MNLFSQFLQCLKMPEKYSPRSFDGRLRSRRYLNAAVEAILNVLTSSEDALHFHISNFSLH